MKSFESRPPIPIALGGLLAIVLVLVAAYNTAKLPFIGDGPTYRAEFSNAAGIRAGNPVKVAGVVVGRVQSVTLADGYVEVAFEVSDAWIGDETRASVQLNTLLGQRFVGLEPYGDEELEEGGAIPLERTTTPYEIVPAINQLTETVGEIDVDALGDSLDVLAETFADTPDDVRGAVDGLSRLSRTVSSRDEELRELLARADEVTTTVAGRDAEIERLIQDLNPLLAELEVRREAISDLLEGAQELSTQLTGLVADNRATLRPALQSLSNVADVLARNEANLEAGIEALGPYVHLFTNTVGTGRWFDAYVCGLIPLPLAGINDEGCETT